MNALDEKLKGKIVYILKRHDVIHAAIFGSYVRNEANDQSDIDLLVELPEKKSLFDLVEIKLDLEDELGKKIDLLTYNSLNSKIRDRILAEKVEIL